MKKSINGYKRDSKDVNEDFNIIPGSDITMKGVDFPILGVDDRGYAKVMYPGYDYNFRNAKWVKETPIRKNSKKQK